MHLQRKTYKTIQKEVVMKIPNKFTEYEQRKQAWKLANPNATPTQFEQAIRRIAKECGL